MENFVNYVKDGKLYANALTTDVMVSAESDLPELVNNLAPGSIAYLPGHVKTWQLSPSETWVEMTKSSSGGGSGGELPIASDDTLGGIKVGSGLSIESDGTLSASGGGGVLYARRNFDSEAPYDELDVTWKEVNDAVQSNKNVAYIYDDGYQYFIIPLYLVQTPNAEHQISYYLAAFVHGSDLYEFYADSENGYLHTID